MDQYGIDFEFCMLYFDALELVELIKNSGKDDLIPYAEELEKQIKEQTE